jgi:hypothetical protein
VPAFPVNQEKPEYSDDCFVVDLGASSGAQRGIGGAPEEPETEQAVDGVSSSGKTRVFGTRIRRFESSHPSQSGAQAEGLLTATGKSTDSLR